MTEIWRERERDQETERERERLTEIWLERERERDRSGDRERERETPLLVLLSPMWLAAIGRQDIADMLKEAQELSAHSLANVPCPAAILTYHGIAAYNYLWSSVGCSTE